jgi:hypothetical protein
MAKSVAASVPLPSQECPEFFDEDSPGWFIREEKMMALDNGTNLAFGISAASMRPSSGGTARSPSL